MALVINDIMEMQRLAEGFRLQRKRIAVVPTMGALHQGHLKLIDVARKHADMVLTTVFVNPTQFGPAEDFARYPRDLERDTQVASNAGTDYVFAPDIESMYPLGYHTYLHVEQLAEVLEGKSRPGHFRGVATVVAKLFNITKPHVAVFGQKDAQQVVLVRRVIQDLNFDIELIVCPIVREPDGLAMSSRNVYLSKDQRSQASVLYKSLQLAETLIRAGERNCEGVIEEMRNLISENSSGVVDYISIAQSSTLEELHECKGIMLVSLAVRFGTTRLIDNMTIEV